MRAAWAAACLALAAGAARAAPPDSPWGAAYFPDVPLVTQDGKAVRFYSDLVKDRFVVIDFVFTHCKASCPLETANLARVQRLLGPRVGRDVFLYSISLDPERDTPEVLKAYARAFHAGPGWLFLTGRREDIERIRSRLGDRSKWQNHAVGLSLGNDPAGQWTSLSALDDAGFLAASIGEWMTIDGTHHAPVRSYADAPRSAPGRGETLFRQRCAACHTIGEGDRIGRDLKGETLRRDRRWLARWLANPGKLQAEGDPLALELAARPVAMPALDLPEDDVAAVLDYLDAGSSGPAGRQRQASRPR